MQNSTTNFLQGLRAFGIVLLLVTPLISFSQFAPASSVSVVDLSPTEIVISWISGSGDGAVVAMTSNTFVSAPFMSNSYSTGSGDFSSGGFIDTDWRAVFDASLGTNTVTVTGLSPSTEYQIYVNEYQFSSTLIYSNLANSEDNFISHFTSESSTAPTVQSSDIFFDAITENSVQIAWLNNGDGDGRVLAMFDGDPATAFFPTPIDGTTYLGNTSFGLGDEIGTGWFVLATGDISSTINVTGLNPDTEYTVALVEYTGDATTELYNTNLATDNPNSFFTASAGPIQTQQAGSWSSTLTWVGGAVPGIGDDVEILHDVTLDTDVNIQNLTITSGVVDLGNSSFELTINGDFAKSGGVFTAGNGKITLDGVDQTYSHIGDITFYDLNIIGSGITTLDYSSGDAMFVENSITIGASSEIAFTDIPDLVLTNTAYFENLGVTNTGNKWSLILDGASHLVNGGSFYDVIWQSASDLTLSSDFIYDGIMETPGSGVIIDLGMHTLYTGAELSLKASDQLNYTLGGIIVENALQLSTNGQTLPRTIIDTFVEEGLFALSTLTFGTDQQLIIQEGTMTFAGSASFDGPSGGISLTGGSLFIGDDQISFSGGAGLVNAGGTVEIIGGFSEFPYTPVLQGATTTDSYTISQSAGSLIISDAELYELGGFGISILGGTVDISNTVFSNGLGNSYLAFADGYDGSTFTGLNFDSGPVNNVIFIGDPTQTVTFDLYSGDLGGPSFSDPGLNGTINWTNPMLPAPGYSLQFDNSDFIQTFDSPLSGTNPFSISAWFKTAKTSGTQAILTTRYAGAFSSTYKIRLSVDGGLSFYVGQQLAANELSSSITGLNDGEWHHVVAVRESTELILYIDGIEDGRVSQTPEFVAATYPLTIGRNVRDVGEQFVGELDEVGIWTVALTESNVLELINNESSSHTESGSLITYYNFDYPNDSPIYDESLNGYDATPNGTFEWVQSEALDLPESRTVNFAEDFSLGIPSSWVSTNVNWDDNTTVGFNGDPGAANVISGPGNGLQTPTLENATYISFQYRVASLAIDGFVFDVLGSSDGGATFDLLIADNESSLDENYVEFYHDFGGFYNGPIKIEFQSEGDSNGYIDQFESDATEEIVPFDNYALQFDGIDQYVSISSAGNIFESQNLTVEAYINPLSTLSYILLSENDGGWGFYVNNGMLSTTNIGIAGHESSIPMPVGEWAHVAITYDNGTLRYYKNGVFQEEAIFTLFTGSSNSTYSMAARSSTTQFSPVELDEIRVWNTTLSDSEIFANYQNELAGSESGLVGYYDFEEGSGSVATDLSISKLDGVLNNMDASSDWIESGVTLGPPLSTQDPVLSGLAIVPGDTFIDIDLTVNVESDLYWLVAVSAEEPTATQIKDGLDKLGNPASSSGTIGAINGTTNPSLGMQLWGSSDFSLVPETDYHLYLVAENPLTESFSNILAGSFTTNSSEINEDFVLEDFSTLSLTSIDGTVTLGTYDWEISNGFGEDFYVLSTPTSLGLEQTFSGSVTSPEIEPESNISFEYASIGDGTVTFSVFEIVDGGSPTLLQTLSTDSEFFTNYNVDTSPGTSIQIRIVVDDASAAPLFIDDFGFYPLQPDDISLETLPVPATTIAQGETQVIYSFRTDYLTKSFTTFGMQFFLGGSFASTDTVGFTLYQNRIGDDFSTATPVASGKTSVEVPEISSGAVGFVFEETFDVNDVAYYYITVTVDSDAGIGNTLNIEQPGANDFAFIDVDPKRNYSLLTAGISFEIVAGDIIAPIITVDNQITNNQTPVLTGTVDDPTATISVEVNSEIVTATNNGNATWTVEELTVALPEGVYDVIATATDGAGNEGVDNTNSELVVDLTSPDVTISANDLASDPVLLDVTFSEKVIGFESSLINISNASVLGEPTTVDDITYVVQLDPIENTEVTISLSAGAVTDEAGNQSEASNTFNFIKDTQSPTVNISTLSTSPTNASLISATVTFSEAVDLLEVSDFTLVNASIDNLVGSGDSYTFDITPVADGDFSVSLAAGVVLDLAGNASEASNVLTLTSDQTSPTASISTLSSSPTNASLISATVTFSEEIDLLEVSDFTLVNASIDNLVGSGDSYTFDITPVADGDFSVSLAAGVVLDLAGNTSEASNVLTLTSDQISPTASITTLSTSPTNASLISATVTFSEAVDLLEVGDFTLVNASIDNLVGSGDSYTFDITPVADGDFSVSLAAGVVLDLAGNTSEASNVLTLTSDQISPTASITTLSTSSTNASLISATVAFSEAIDLLEVSDFTLVNASIDNLVGSGDSYTFDITPVADGDFSVSLAAGVVLDLAGNTSEASNVLTLTSDQISPTASITTLSTSSTNASLISATVAFSEAIDLLEVSDFTLVNASIDNLVGSGDSYTFDITPVADGDFSVSLAAGVVLDLAGNASEASNVLTLTSDQISPTASITTLSTSSTNASLISATVAFSEAIDLLEVSDFTLVNASIDNLVGSGDSYTFDITPVADGDFSVSLAAGVVLDLAGNASEASNVLTLTSDQTSPTASITTLSSSPTNASLISATVTFSEEIDLLEVSDFTLVNASIDNLVGSGDSYTFDITPVADGDFSVSLAAGVVSDLAGNSSEASNILTLTSDQTSPTASITTLSSSPTNASLISATVAFSEAVDLLEVSDFTLVNASIDNLVGSGDSYTFDITPTADGDFSVLLAAGVVLDLAGNASEASNVLTLIFDGTPPSAVLTTPISSPTNAEIIPITITFSEPVTGLANDDFILNNATLDIITGSFTTYTANVTPLADGNISVSVIANGVQDFSGNSSTPSNELLILFDQTAPIVSISDLTTLEDSPEISGTVDDENATVTLTVNEETVPALNTGTGTWLVAANSLASLAVNTYEMTVTAEDLAGNTSSVTANLSIQGGPTETLLASNIGFFTFTANWRLRAEVVSYEFDLSTHPDFTTFVGGYDAFEVIDNSLDISDLEFDTEYYYRVRAKYGDGTISISSNVTNVRTSLDPGTTADANALLQVYAALGGENWTQNNNWTSEPRITNWEGVIIPEGNTRVTEVDLSGSNLSGSFPEIESGLESLISLDLSNNAIVNIPVLDGLSSLTALNISQNALEFDGLEANIDVETYSFNDQDSVLNQIDTLLEIGNSYTFTRQIAGSSNNYQWFKQDLDDPSLITTLSTGSSLSLNITDFNQEGNYYVEVKSGVLGLESVTLISRKIIVKVSSLERDVRALQSIYNSTGGANWSNAAGWETLSVATVGNLPNDITVTESRVTALDLSGQNLTGTLPREINDLASLSNVNLSNNSLTGISRIDLTRLKELQSVNISGNSLDFGDLEKNAGLVTSINTFIYNNQANIAVTETRVPQGSDYLIELEVGGVENQYSWSLSNHVANDQPLDQSAKDYQITGITYETMGSYEVEVTNSLLPDLTILSDPIVVLATANLFGVVQGVDDEPLAAGIMDAFKIGEPDQPYDTADIVDVTLGQFVIENLVLGDYVCITDSEILNNEGDKLYLPTYFGNTDLWTEADSIFLREDTEVFDYIMSVKPQKLDPIPGNEGSVFGVVEAEFNNSGGRILDRRKVKKAGCSVRRFKARGRGESQQDGTYELIAYVETNDNGEFEFDFLPAGLYRFNIEYPGIPMDPDSFVEFEIGGDGFDANNFKLEAFITNGGIEVTRVSALAIYEQYFLDLNVYPVPASQYINIQYDRLLADKVAVRLIDLSGQVISEKDMQKGWNQTYQFDVSEVSEGAYILHFLDPADKLIVSYKVYVRH